MEDTILDFATLREAGMQHIRELAGDTWTDHNTHDPGITLLEQLCYTLSDLSYRTGFSVPDLLAEGQDKPAWPDLFRKAKMLDAGPVHLTDWRKVLLDTPGVRNAWIQPLDTTSDVYDSRLYFDSVENVLQMTPPFLARDSDRSYTPLAVFGLYRVVFIPDYGQNPALVQKLIRQRLHERRNLCEDFHQIGPLAKLGISLKADVEIGDVSDPAALLARIYFAVYDYMSPRIKFYTLQERLAAGHAPDDILDGPLLTHGFIDDRELESFALRSSLRISDLIRLIMDLDGVRAVNTLRISVPGSESDKSDQSAAMEGDRSAWEMIIPPNYTPELNIPGAPAPDFVPEVGVRLFKSGFPVRVDWQIARNWFVDLMRAENVRTSRQTESLVPDPAPGRSRRVATYQSIQRQFPELYGVGPVGLPASVSPQRKAQARQFKAYLGLFDQLLANTFAQLGGVRDLFSQTPETASTTYFSQSLRDEIPDFEPLIHWGAFGLDERAPEEEKKKKYGEKLQILASGGMGDPAAQTRWDRRNRLLNHLLARFGEQITEYDPWLKEQLFATKKAMLNDYPNLSRNRGKGFDYTRNAWDTDNVSGLEKRLACLLGFAPAIGSLLSDLPPDAAGSFYLVEHILFRPDLGDKDQTSPLLKLPLQLDDNSPQITDPFSFQLSFVFPDWLERFDDALNPGFRDTVFRTVREETPAHLRIYIHWLGVNEMKVFETSYKNWLEHLKER